MSTKYTVSAANGAAKWCTVLAKSISDNFNSLSAEFRDTHKKMCINYQYKTEVCNRKMNNSVDDLTTRTPTVEGILLVIR